MPSTSPSRRRWAVASATVAILLWALVAHLVDRDIVLPGPLRTLAYLGTMSSQWSTWEAIAATLRRVALSFSSNLVLALALGMGAGFIQALEEALKPLVTVMKAVPTMGVILLSVIWFDSETAVVFVTTLIVFPVLYSAVLSGVHHLDQGLIQMHRVFHIPLFTTLRRFLLPSLRPQLTAGIASGIGLSMKVVVAAEVLSQPGTGIGTMFQVERASLNTAGVFAWSLVVVVLTAGLDLLLAALKHRGEVSHARS